MTLYGQSFEPAPVPNATTVSVDAASTLNASAITSGNGGKIVVWSNADTTFAGTALAKGGIQSGNGGFIETSGQTLNIDGSTVSTGAPKGQSGRWLLDPSDYTIDQSAATNIEAALENGNVSIVTAPDGNAGNGDIIVNSGISWLTSAILLLDSYHGVTVNAAINGTNLAVVTNDGGSGGYFTVNTPVSLTSSLLINGANYTLINSAQDLENISDATGGNYALTSDVNLTQPFSPIGGVYSGTWFGGSFEGLGHTITGLNVANTTPWTNNLPGDGYYIGLFGNFGGGIVENLTLSNASVTLNNSGGAGAGLLAAQSSGTIYTVKWYNL